MLTGNQHTKNTPYTVATVLVMRNIILLDDSFFEGSSLLSLMRSDLGDFDGVRAREKLDFCGRAGEFSVVRGKVSVEPSWSI